MYQRGLTVSEISNLLLVPESMIANVIESLENGEYGDDFACEFDIVTEEE